MTIPQYLIDCYTAIQATALVHTGDTTPQALAEFARHLNAAQSLRTIDTVQYDTIQTLYRANRRDFINCIRSANEPFVLWTDGRAILNWFGLNRIVYCKCKDGRFWVRPIQQAKPADFTFPVIQGNEVVINTLSA